MRTLRYSQPKPPDWFERVLEEIAKEDERLASCLGSCLVEEKEGEVCLHALSDFIKRKLGRHQGYLESKLGRKVSII